MGHDVVTPVAIWNCRLCYFRIAILKIAIFVCVNRGVLAQLRPGTLALKSMKSHPLMKVWGGGRICPLLHCGGFYVARVLLYKCVCLKL